MNFYKRHIGDYLKDTSHLTLLEHGIYTRLLDIYYTRETGIPEDQAARLIGARTKEERAALAAVLDEFFILDGDTYRQTRADREIADSQAKAERNREVGKKGGRPPKNRNQNGLNQEPTKNPDGFQTEPTNNPSHKPLANINPKDTLLPTQPTPTPLPSPRVAVDNSKPYGKAAAALIPLGVRITAQHPTLIAWIDEGFTIDQLTAAVAIARLNKPEPEAIPANYLDRIVRDPPKPSKPKERRAAWWETEQGILAQGAELGMVPRAGEGWPEFKQRISVELDRRKTA